MNPDYKHIGILLILVIIASGCGDNPEPEGATNNAISVNSFGPSSSPVRSGMTFRLDMEIENIGDAEATNTQAWLFGPAFLNDMGDEVRTLEWGSLEKASDTSFARSKGTSITAPEVDEGRESTYNIYSKIFFGYETTAETDIKVVSYDRFEEQGYSRGKASMESSSGPIKLGIQGQTPIRFDSSNSDGDNTGTINRDLCITIDNVGGGTPFSGTLNGVPSNGDIPNDRENKVALSVEEDSEKLNLEPQDSETVSLRKGYLCYTLSTADEEALTQPETNLNLEVKADYNYAKETSTSVTVEGRR